MEKFLTEIQIQELKIAHKKIKTKRDADKIKTICLLNKKFSYQQIAEILLLDDQTIRRYFNIYKEKGLTKLLQNNFQGCQCKLSKNQIEKLITHLEQNTYQTALDIANIFSKNIKLNTR